MPTISVVIIAKNEEKRIANCIRSVAGLADEILIGDSGSMDRTNEIAMGLGAKVISLEWKSYAETKNELNELATGEFILSLDADEELSPELKENLHKLKSELKGAYQFNRKGFYSGKWIRRCGWYPDRKVRLFPKGKAKWTGAFVHEKLELASDISITQTNGDILHYTYDSIADHIATINHYSELGADEIVSKNEKALLLKLLFKPQLKFFKMFILKMGILDGFYGFVLSMLSSWETFLKYAKAREKRGK